MVASISSSRYRTHGQGRLDLEPHSLAILKADEERSDEQLCFNIPIEVALERRSPLRQFHCCSPSTMATREMEPIYPNGQATRKSANHRECPWAVQRLAATFLMMVSESRTTRLFNWLFSLFRLSSACFSRASRSTSLERLDRPCCEGISCMSVPSARINRRKHYSQI
jgi:hypothetical protein